MSGAPGRISGFTLIEVLVALAVVAVALGAGLRAAAVATDNTLALRERTLARWVAENELNRIRVRPGLPAPGQSDGEAEQGGQRFVWQASVETTPNSNFRRIVLRVRHPESAFILAEAQGFTVGGR